MTSEERVKAALNFVEPDRVPRFWSAFWPAFVEKWQQSHDDSDPHRFFGGDVRLVAADETAVCDRTQGARDKKSDSLCEQNDEI